MYVIEYTVNGAKKKLYFMCFNKLLKKFREFEAKGYSPTWRHK